MDTRSGLGAALAVLALCLAACGGGSDHHHERYPGYKVDTGPSSGLETPGEAGVDGRPPSQRTTSLISTANGGFPNGPSRNAAVSHDQRIARYIAYESDASNIVAGDTNGQTDIFLVFRAQPFGQDGTPWRAAGTQLISSGINGQPANGPSYRPVLDGDAHHAPHCVAFMSAASNLVPGDTNDKPDGFVYDIDTKTIKRVTVDSAGGQSNGSTYDISISGHCFRVAFTSDATNLALTEPTRPAWEEVRRDAVQRRTPTRQVYVHILGGTRLNAGFAGLTFLASAASDGAPGNGSSGQPSIARAGKSVVFSSAATNLASGDKSRISDIYRRTIIRKFKHLGNGKGVQTLQGSTSLVSATLSGRSGNGASTHPTVTDDSRYVAFQTDASNLLPGDTNGVTDIARADVTRKPQLIWVSKTPGDGIGNGPSRDPVISDAGEFVLFDSEATNLRASASHPIDPNGTAPALVWQPNGLDPSILPPLSNPDVSAPDLPRPVSSAGFIPPADTASVDQAAKAATTAGQQIYLRYLGAK